MGCARTAGVGLWPALGRADWVATGIPSSLRIYDVLDAPKWKRSPRLCGNLPPPPPDRPQMVLPSAAEHRCDEHTHHAKRTQAYMIVAPTMATVVSSVCSPS